MLPSSFPKLETKHLVWIVDSAFESFATKLAEAEHEIVRHMAFTGTPLHGKIRDESRAEKIASLNEFVRQYRDILRVLRVLREKASDRAATEFVAEFLAHIQHQHVS